VLDRFKETIPMDGAAELVAHGVTLQERRAA
jgi:hypothetical protein